MSKILITGITGFIGSNLAIQLVKNGWSVIGTYRNEKRLHRISEIKDLVTLVKDTEGGFQSVKRIIKKTQIDTLYHLAAQSSHIFSLNNPLDDLINNVHPLINILDYLKDISLAKRPYIVFPSSKGVLGTPTYQPVDENHSCVPEDPYSLNKWYDEQFLNLYSRKYGISSSTFRLTNVFGPKQQIISSQKGFINYFIGLGLRNKAIEVFGEGNQKRDISYISDIINALCLAGSKKLPNSNIFFLGTGIGVSIREIAEKVCELTGTTLNFNPFPLKFKKIEVGDFIVNNTKAKENLKWKPLVEWSEGLLKTVNYYKQNLQAYLDE